MMNFKKFIYLKKQEVTEIGTRHEWYLINKAERVGVHFHGMKYNEVSESLRHFTNQYNFATYGLEVHRKKPVHAGQTPVPNCHVTGGDCYCDGTSLYARERLGHVYPDGSFDAEIWHVLEDFYFTNFEKGETNE